ncbi:hypothetical protein QR98_0023330 [Sarcoptes scabiei]|uniref:Claspin-like protein n=1 Tax=Sarcoptes scabiei TaxID=52283 RepID=A0A131ZYY7_SARSC|nr:hypothetical protein QR98_0023330 [Sarcoptes scabiei]
MIDLKKLIAESKRNVPPLNLNYKNDGTDGEIILIDSKNSLVQKLFAQKSGTECIDEKKRQANWLGIKDKMLNEMENKRNQEWEEQNKKVKELEEEDEEDFGYENCDHNENDVVDQVESINLDEKNVENSYDVSRDSSNLEKKSNDEQEVSSDEEEDEMERSDENCTIDEDSDEEEIVCARKKTKMISIIDEDQEDDENSREIEEIGLSFENQNDISSTFERKFDEFTDSKTIDYSLGDNIFISQDLPKTQSSSMVEKSINDVYDSQMLLDLCSGQFNQIDQIATSIMIEDQDQNQPEEDEDLETIRESESQPKKILKVKDFIEDEAELSGDEEDVSSDESDDEDQDNFIEDLIQDDSDSEANREQIERIHHKNMLDEDKRQLMIMKEYFFEDGDLYDGDGDRRKKFRWDLLQDEEALADLVNTFSDSDDDFQSDAEIEDDDSQTKMQPIVRLKRTLEEVNVEENGDNGDDHDGISQQSTKELNSIDDETMKRMKIIALKFKLQRDKAKKSQASLSKFIIRDERFKTIINNSNSNEMFKKRAKINQKDDVSVFDFL